MNIAARQDQKHQAFYAEEITHVNDLLSKYPMQAPTSQRQLSASVRVLRGELRRLQTAVDAKIVQTADENKRLLDERTQTEADRQAALAKAEADRQAATMPLVFGSSIKTNNGSYSISVDGNMNAILNQNGVGHQSLGCCISQTSQLPMLVSYHGLECGRLTGQKSL
jgi:hypothetical protein